MKLISDPLAGVYLLCAAFGFVFLIMQFVMMLVGVGGDLGDGAGDMGDAGGDVGGDVGEAHVEAHSGGVDVFKILSLRTGVAGITFFGLGGMIGLSGGFGHALSIIFALGAGMIALYAVYYLYQSFVQMRSDGNVSEKTLVGASGNVYVRIPSAGGGAGKVLVNQQNRTMEYEAISSGSEIKTGTPVVVVRIVSPTMVEVAVSE